MSRYLADEAATAQFASEVLAALPESLAGWTLLLSGELEQRVERQRERSERKRDLAVAERQRARVLVTDLGAGYQYLE